MAEQERKAIRDAKLIAYIHAVDDRKAHCGRLSNLIDTLRKIVAQYDRSSLDVRAGEPESPPIEDGTPEGCHLPSQEDLVGAILECQVAKQDEDRLYAEALDAGVDKDRLQALGAPEKKARRKITVAGSLA